MPRHLVSQRCQIHHSRHAGEVLHDHAGGFEGHLFAFIFLRLPVGQSDHIFFRDLEAVALPQRRFQQHFDGVRQP